MGVKDQWKGSGDIPVMKGLELQQKSESRDRYLWAGRVDETNKKERVEQNEKKTMDHSGDAVI